MLPITSLHCFETGSHWKIWTGLSILPQSPECLDYSHEPPCPAPIYTTIWQRLIKPLRIESTQKATAFFSLQQSMAFRFTHTMLIKKQKLFSFLSSKHKHLVQIPETSSVFFNEAKKDMSKVCRFSMGKTSHKIHFHLGRSHTHTNTHTHTHMK
jgi:hypothetical protein